VWCDADSTEQLVLIGEAPELFDPRWDAFLAVYVKYLCGHEELQAPTWTGKPDRYLPKMWWAADYFPFERGRVVVTTPPVFETHGIRISDNDLLIV